MRMGCLGITISPVVFDAHRGKEKSKKQIIKIIKIVRPWLQICQQFNILLEVNKSII